MNYMYTTQSFTVLHESISLIWLRPALVPYNLAPYV